MGLLQIIRSGLGRAGFAAVLAFGLAVVDAPARAAACPPRTGFSVQRTFSGPYELYRLTLTMASGTINVFDTTARSFTSAGGEQVGVKIDTFGPLECPPGQTCDTRMVWTIRDECGNFIRNISAGGTISGGYSFNCDEQLAGCGPSLDGCNRECTQDLFIGARSFAVSGCICNFYKVFSFTLPPACSGSPSTLPSVNTQPGN